MGIARSETRPGFPIRVGLRTLQGAVGVLWRYRLILFYESFNHRAEILALLKDSNDLVFESDRHQALAPISNFIALPYDCASAVTSALAALAYPISLPRG